MSSVRDGTRQENRRGFQTWTQSKIRGKSETEKPVCLVKEFVMVSCHPCKKRSTHRSALGH